MTIPCPYFYFFVPGIMTGHDSWSDEAIKWINRNLEGVARADQLEYNCGPLTRMIGQAERIRYVAKAIRNNQEIEKNDKVVLVGHSNGAEVVLKALLHNPGISVSELHLV